MSESVKPLGGQKRFGASNIAAICFGIAFHTAPSIGGLSCSVRVTLVPAFSFDEVQDMTFKLPTPSDLSTACRC